METTARLHSLTERPVNPDKSHLLTIPPFLYVSVFSSFCVIVGLIWDISWHITIGRDGLLSPPHLVVYLGAVLAGLVSGYQILKTTFAGTPEEKRRSVRFWGVFYSPLGALFCVWGAFAMLTSAPFDDWWHNAYGLDVKILSPPHTVLALGIAVLQFGAMISALALQNRSHEQAAAWREEVPDRRNGVLRWLFIVSAGLLLTMLFGIVSEELGRHAMHHSRFYRISGAIFPFFMVAVARSSKLKWAATATAGVFIAVALLMNWILPLFPAEPKLGPILNHVTHFQPYRFPLLLIIPGLAIDWLMNRYTQANDWLLALGIGVSFVLLMLAVHWPLGDFLMSPYARNWFFGQESWYFGLDPNWPYRYAFSPTRLQTPAAFLKGLAFAALFVVVSARVGLYWGKWMQKVQR